MIPYNSIHHNKSLNKCIYVFIAVHAQALDDCRLNIIIFCTNVFKNSPAHALLLDH